MSNAIVMNTLNGAVTEYDGFDFQSITPTHAGSALGLYALGGDLDNLATIDAAVETGKTLQGTSLKKFVEAVYFSIKGEGTGTMVLKGETATYRYTFDLLPSGQSRAKAGRGIRENYMSFGFENRRGGDFLIDRIEALTQNSTTRRI